MTSNSTVTSGIILGCIFASSTRAQICLESQQQIPAGNGGSRVRPSRNPAEPRILPFFGVPTKGRNRKNIQMDRFICFGVQTEGHER